MRIKAKEELEIELAAIRMISQERPLTKEEERKVLTLESAITNYDALRGISKT